MILEAHPEVVFVYNEAYDETNTSQSLLRALRATNDGGVLWMNGDVVFEGGLLARTIPLIEAEPVLRRRQHRERRRRGGQVHRRRRGMDPRAVQDRRLRRSARRSASTTSRAADKAALIRRLGEVDDQDYFERGIELAIEHDGLRFAALDISELAAVEVDTPDDLARANARTATAGAAGWTAPRDARAACAAARGFTSAPHRPSVRERIKRVWPLPPHPATCSSRATSRCATPARRSATCGRSSTRC